MYLIYSRKLKVYVLNAGSTSILKDKKYCLDPLDLCNSIHASILSLPRFATTDIFQWTYLAIFFFCLFCILSTCILFPVECRPLKRTCSIKILYNAINDCVSGLNRTKIIWNSPYYEHFESIVNFHGQAHFFYLIWV